MEQVRSRSRSTTIERFLCGRIDKLLEEGAARKFEKKMKEKRPVYCSTAENSATLHELYKHSVKRTEPDPGKEQRILELYEAIRRAKKVRSEIVEHAIGEETGLKRHPSTLSHMNHDDSDSEGEVEDFEDEVLSAPVADAVATKSNQDDFINDVESVPTSATAENGASATTLDVAADVDRGDTSTTPYDTTLATANNQDDTLNAVESLPNSTKAGDVIADVDRGDKSASADDTAVTTGSYQDDTINAVESLPTSTTAGDVAADVDRGNASITADDTALATGSYQDDTINAVESLPTSATADDGASATAGDVAVDIDGDYTSKPSDLNNNRAL